MGGATAGGTASGDFGEEAVNNSRGGDEWGHGVGLEGHVDNSGCG